MKKTSSHLLWRTLLIVAGLVFAMIDRSLAQTSGGTNTTVPVVTIRATDPGASEAGGGTNTGTFTVTRDGPTNATLNVFYLISGSASNGVDYATLGNYVLIPAGVRTVQIKVQPIDDSDTESPENVNLRLSYPPTMPPINYNIGYPSEATVNIEDNDRTPGSNQPPTVHIVTPTNNATFAAPANIQICADARDADGYINFVEFFAGNMRIGARTNCLPCASIQNPFCLTWTNVPPGDYVLTAKATDNLGAMTTSDPVHISVKQQQPHMPVVTITAPDPNASEPCQTSNLPSNLDTGKFIVRRSDGTNNPLTVLYTISGTASNGVDYASLSGSVTIPVGAYAADIVVVPSADSLPEATETVVLRLPPMACIAIFPPPPECYEVGSPSEAIVYIRNCEPHITNAPPKVVITAPTNGAVFTAPVNIEIVTDTVDADGYVGRVEFFANDHKIGEDSKQFFVAPTNGSHIDYSMVWSNPPPGLYSLKSKAIDNLNGIGFSEPVRITVTGTNKPPETNFPPVVTISALDGIAAEGTNCWRWYSNSIGINDRWPSNYCGINTATFIVRRTGSTNSSLTINYAIGGTASNGVDYATIPDSVTIPVGERSVRITITPIDDTIPECNETVVLKLISPTNTPPEYRVGWPGAAAAVVVDNDLPPPGTGLLCDRTFHLCKPAANGFCYRLELSLDMVHWLPICTNTVSELGITFTDPESSDFPTRFYRVVPEACPPSQP